MTLTKEQIEELKKQLHSQIKKMSENIPSKKIDENPSAVAVLEIKPISKGHVIIIPKEKMLNIDKIPTEISLLIDKVSKNIVEKLKAKNMKVAPESKFGEVIVNLIPIYDKELSLESERSSPSEEELDSLEKELKKEVKKEEPKEIKEEKKEPIKKFPKRIP